MSLIKTNFTDWPNLSSFFDNDWLKNHLLNNNWLPAVNVVDNNGNYEVELAAPGFKKEDIKVSIENKSLVIS